MLSLETDVSFNIFNGITAAAGYSCCNCIVTEKYVYENIAIYSCNHKINTESNWAFTK